MLPYNLRSFVSMAWMLKKSHPTVESVNILIQNPAVIWGSCAEFFQNLQPGCVLVAFEFSSIWIRAEVFHCPLGIRTLYYLLHRWSWQSKELPFIMGNLSWAENRLVSIQLWAGGNKFSIYQSCTFFYTFWDRWWHHSIAILLSFLLGVLLGPWCF